MTFNGVMAVILCYFTELVYGVVVKQLPRFQNLLLIVYDYTVSQKKTVQISFCQKFVKFPQILVIFGRKMAKRLKLRDLHSFSTSSNLYHHTTVLNADVPNCYTTLKVVIFNKLSSDLISTQ